MASDFQAFAVRRVRGAMLDGLRRDGALRRGETLFDADAVDSAAQPGGTSPEDPLALLLARRQPHRAGGGAAHACRRSNTGCSPCIFTTK